MGAQTREQTHWVLLTPGAVADAAKLRRERAERGVKRLKESLMDYKGKPVLEGLFRL